MAWWLAATSRWRTACWNAGPTKPVFCSHFRRQIKAVGGFYLASGTASERTPGSPAPLDAIERLLDLDLRAGFFHLLLDGFRVGLVDAFLDGLGRAVDEILGLLEAQARHFAHGLDGVHLVLAGGGEDHGELGLLFGRGTTGGGATGRGGGDGDGGGGGNAELLFHVLDELRQLEDGHAADLLE